MGITPLNIDLGWTGLGVTQRGRRHSPSIPHFCQNIRLHPVAATTYRKIPQERALSISKAIRGRGFAFYELLIQTTRTSRKRATLLQADMELEKLRLYMRLAHARKLTSQNQYHFASEALAEIGRLLGGWLKTIPEK